MFKRIITLVISLVLIISVIPTAFVANASTDNMLRFQVSKIDSGYDELRAIAPVAVGKTYYYSFSMTKETDGCFEVVCRNDNDGGNKHGINADIKQVAKNAVGLTYRYTYSFTIPENDNSSTAVTANVFFIIRFKNVCNGCLFNASIFESTDSEKTELLSNGKFINDMKGWYLESTALSNKGLEWTDGTYVSLNIESLDSDLIRTDLYARMMHIRKTKTTGNCELKTSVPVQIGNTYNFSFMMSNTIDESHFEVVARVNNGTWSQPGVASNRINRISKVEKGKSILYTYSIPITESDSSNIGTYPVYFIIRFKNSAVCDGYLFGVSAVEATDESKKELLSDPDFSLGLKGWVGGFTGYKENTMSGIDSNQTTELEILPFNEALIEECEPTKMLLIEKTATNDVFELRAPVAVKVGNKYSYSFALTDTISENDFELVFRVVANAWGERKGVNATVNKESVSTKGKAKYYTYSVTIPQTAGDGSSLDGKSVYFILRLKKPVICSGYYFDAKITDLSDSYAMNLISNAGFENGLQDWSATNRDFTTVVTEGKDNNNTTTLRVVDFDSELYKTMLKIRNESVDMQGESLLLPIGTLSAGTNYKASFSYYFVNGALDESVDFVLIDSPSDNNKRTRVIQSSVETGPIEYSVENDGIHVSYTFSLNDEQANNYTNLYAGFFFRQEARYITELYVADFKVCRVDDESNTNLLQKKNYWDMEGWRSNYKTAAKGSESFGSAQTDSVDYTASYVAYDEALFTNEKEFISYGDGNYDGKIDILDLVAAKKTATGNRTYYSSLDFDCDGTINADDLIFLRKHLLGLEPIIRQSYKSDLIATPQMSGGADAKADELRKAISDFGDTILNANSKRVFYVAANGSDSNDGLSADRPITVNKLSEIEYADDDAILFRRGDIFRIGEYLSPQSGVSYGAYGSGAKPVISGSLKNYADRELWHTTDGNLWQIYVSGGDVGSVVMNGGEYYGAAKRSIDEIKNDGDFCFDSKTGILYLYLRQINPASRFDSIEISSTRRFMNGEYVSDMTVENLNLVCFREHAINLIDCNNVQIRGCEFSWIGGGYVYDSKTGERTESRYGNAIQFWRAAKNCNVSTNGFYHIYDAAMTFQGNSGSEYSNLKYTDNLVEYSGMNFEFWDSDDKVIMKDIDFTGNILRFAGYGFCSQRKNKENMAYVLTWNNVYENSTIQNFNITGNIFDIANCCFYYATKSADKFSINANTYYQNGNGFYCVNRGSIVYASNSGELLAEMQKIDANPTVGWIN